jgi:hypothetical protein
VTRENGKLSLNGKQCWNQQIVKHDIDKKSRKWRKCLFIDINGINLIQRHWNYSMTHVTRCIPLPLQGMQIQLSSLNTCIIYDLKLSLWQYRTPSRTLILLLLLLLEPGLLSRHSDGLRAGQPGFDYRQRKGFSSPFRPDWL